MVVLSGASELTGQVFNPFTVDCIYIPLRNASELLRFLRRCTWERVLHPRTASPWFLDRCKKSLVIGCNENSRKRYHWDQRKISKITRRVRILSQSWLLQEFSNQILINAERPFRKAKRDEGICRSGWPVRETRLDRRQNRTYTQLDVFLRSQKNWRRNQMRLKIKKRFPMVHGVGWTNLLATLFLCHNKILCHWSFLSLVDCCLVFERTY